MCEQPPDEDRHSILALVVGTDVTLTVAEVDRVRRTLLIGEIPLTVVVTLLLLVRLLVARAERGHHALGGDRTDAVLEGGSVRVYIGVVLELHGPSIPRQRTSFTAETRRAAALSGRPRTR